MSWHRAISCKQIYQLAGIVQKKNNPANRSRILFMPSRFNILNIRRLFRNEVIKGK